ncbi:PREDICTED: uncharacterized skeletal organic matrix protein 5-like isoform X3 [Acropora digitifera]|uniref:uncharacterized skeletal organic matrix protein 5-like isoform X3 n=1 Tax=Acropora digitifera TaxID=70779 RepID=UPI00077A46CC|nr:PREDICTED: uncharacterized skeletal organic matrix protein 5-like isoform X3 [Acropora digitifera]
MGAARFLVQVAIFLLVKPARSAPAPMRQGNSTASNSCSKPSINNCSCRCELSPASTTANAVSALEDKIDQVIALVNRTTPRHSAPVAPISSCKEQFDKNNSSPSQVYELTFGSEVVPVYCHMGNFGCGNGGWTLAMKMDGTKTTFLYDSDLWSARFSYNPAAGKTGFDMLETKLPTYWSTPFHKVCLGMRVSQQLNFVVLNVTANSLFSLIADGRYRATSLGRNMWKSLIGTQASLQRNCNREGFNVRSGYRKNSKARIGVIGNQKNNCRSCDSRIGFGTGGTPDNTNSCGNDAHHSGDNGRKRIVTMGYILVQ